MNLKEAREELAALMNGLEYSSKSGPKPFRLTARPVKGNLRRGDGFVTVGPTSPDDFARSHLATLNAWLILGQDEGLADEDVDELTLPALDLVVNWGGMDVTIQPSAMVGGESIQGEVFVLTLTCSVEVQS